MADFFAMGGYAAFVWPCFGVAALLLVALGLFSLTELRSNRRRLNALQEASAQSTKGRRAGEAEVQREAQA
ncbi:MAG: heme exporter protein CcmD [Rhodospirillales bacterium]